MSVIGPEDPMVQQVMEANQRQLEIQAFIKGLEVQVMTAVFSQLALQHYQSGEALTIEAGRKIADTAVAVRSGYIGFLLENLGMATVSKVDDETNTMQN